MKTYFNYALLSAIAFVGATGFTACSSSDDVVENNVNNPDYNPATNSVKTTITLSIDPNGSASTRMATNTVQVGYFRGIQDIWLIPSNAAIGTGTSTTSKIELGAIDKTGTGGFDSGKENQKTYTDKEVPVGTTNFLLLGKATQGDVTTPAGMLANGYTTNNIGAGAAFTATTVGNIAINSVGIAPVTDGADPVLTDDDWNTPAGNLASYLGSIANATGWANATNPTLASLRHTFCNTSLTAGSSASILLTLERLYNAVEGTDATIAGNIRTAILVNLQVKSTSTSHPYELEWKSGASVLTNFPVNLGLPEGAAQYRWNTTSSAFEYVTEPTLNASNTKVMNIVYPNELYYMTSTALKATDTKTVSWPTTLSGWTSSEWSGWGDAVSATSKNIALKNNIQYGTALLSSTVRVEATTLYDNAKAMDPTQPGANKEITVTSTSFPLTGVLIGGQPSVVGWNFLPTGTVFTKVVYDANVPADIYAASTSASAKNYTLVFDNLTSGTDQNDVMVCLEFTNNSGSDFYGSNGIILKDQKFYIVGKLVIGNNTFPYPNVGDPAVATTASDIAEKTASYYPSLTPRIFIQDFETIANFTLKAGDANTPGSLGKAIVTLPDLRPTNQTLGLSVDLEWKGGLSFNVDLGQ